MGKTASISVEHTGVSEEDKLIGYREHNLALVIQIFEDLDRRSDGKIGRIEGVPLEILHPGCGEYHEIFAMFTGRRLTREEIAQWAAQQQEISPEFRSKYPRFNENFNALNANSLFQRESAQA